MVWPYKPGVSCANYGGPVGWTWYIHKAASRSGTPTLPSYENGINGGRANVGFGDGHAKSLKYSQLEKCDFFTGPKLWVWTYFDPRY